MTGFLLSQEWQLKSIMDFLRNHFISDKSRGPGFDSPQRGVLLITSTQGGLARFFKTISHKKSHRTSPQPNIWGLRPWTPRNLLLIPQTPNIGLPPLDEIDMVLKKWARPDWAHLLQQSQLSLIWSWGPGFPCWNKIQWQSKMVGLFKMGIKIRARKTQLWFTPASGS